MERAARRGHDLLADPVAGQQRDGHDRAPVTAVVARRCSTAASSATTSPYLASMSNRFASCGPCARSPTHSRGTRTGKPYWIASTHEERTHPLVVAPHTT